MSDDRPRDSVVPFPSPPTPAADAPDIKVEVDATEAGFSIRVPLPPGFDLQTELAAMREQATVREARLARVRRTHLQVPPDVSLIVSALMEALATERHAFNDYDRTGRLEQSYESFRCYLRVAGFADGWQHRRDRALGHRRLGELAEGRGDLVAALWHYDQAVKSWKNVGCRRRRTKLRQEP